MKLLAWQNGRLVQVRLLQPRGERGRYVGQYGTFVGLTDEDKKVILKQDNEAKLYIEEELS